MDKKVPFYLLEKKNTVRMILFTAIFALLFINLFQPFGSRNWYPNISDFKYFFFSSLIILTGMLVVVVSRLFMGLYIRRHELNYLQYAILILSEILAMSLFFSLFSRYLPSGGKERDFMQLFQNSFVNTSLVLLLPYSISILFFSWKEKNRLLKVQQEDDGTTSTHKKSLIGFQDEKGELKISIILENLVLIESADNYATIYYINKDKLSTFLIRNSLKWIEENLTKDTSLVRCHRSYIINLDKVSVFKKTKNGIFMELETPNTPDIPVSKTYYNKVMEKFSQYSI
ncbi:MAG: putative two-component response-regulatory protein YehT [Bacteroidetes bacterium ADurb.Bin174]|nr:MAG: putative two-component response-regulatory protein YehT [Bacteroidetes bacterium ADurb.Bin174]